MISNNTYRHITTPNYSLKKFIYYIAVGEKDIEKSKDYAASLIKFQNVIPVLLFLFWTFCSPLVFKLMGVSENVMKSCVTYTRIYAPVYLIIGLGASYCVVFQTLSEIYKAWAAYCQRRFSLEFGKSLYHQNPQYN